ncbi:MAG: LytTR family transcriptional regulator [Saccharofermentans sp.]|jgi:DNA-binding LytR/AlgR family response regulator|nr:LytTR family transcriptional regulator [Saccharofermentans sp.]
MQVTIRQDLESGTAVEIHCREITSETERLERYIRRFDERIIGSSEGQAHTIALEQILYIEAVDKKTFLYTPNNVYETDKKLYELETVLDEKTFFRCSKSVIVNLNKITRLKPEVTRNILATLTNGEVVVISRRNVKQLKALIGLD